MKVLLTTLNAKYIHRNLALRWLYVAQNGDHDVILKEYTIKDSLERISKEIKEINPDIIGISTYIWNGEYVKKWVKILKDYLPNCRIVLGGPEVSYQYQDYLCDFVDAIILGEGEISFWQYVNNQKGIKGIVTKDYIDHYPVQTDISFLESLPSPYLLDFDFADMTNRYLYVEASRGCPYSCKYCMASLDNNLRYFSLDYLFNLFDQLEKTNVKQIKFLDRTFNASKERSYKIAERLMKFREDCSFQFEVMCDTLADELVELINSNPIKSRFRFEVGIQSFNQKTLKEVRRFQNLEKLQKNLSSLVAHKAIVHADLIGGLPYEDINSFADTYNKLFAYKVDEMQVGILKLLKGSKLREEMAEYGIVCQKETPYTIIANKWVSNDDILKIERVALATERLWNRNQTRHTLWYLYQNDYDMFDLMEKIGTKLSLLPRPYQIHEFYKAINDCLNDKKAQAILANEYYYHFKQRPVRYKDIELSKKDKHQLFSVLVKNGLVNANDVRYSYFDTGYYLGEIVKQILIYNSDERYPIRYFVTDSLQYLGKEDLNERCNDCYGE